MNKSKFDIAVVGGGIIGLATAFQFQNNYSDLNIVVLEKEKSWLFIKLEKILVLFIQVCIMSPEVLRQITVCEEERS